MRSIMSPNCEILKYSNCPWIGPRCQKKESRTNLCFIVTVLNRKLFLKIAPFLNSQQTANNQWERRARVYQRVEKLNGFPTFTNKEGYAYLQYYHQINSFVIMLKDVSTQNYTIVKEVYQDESTRAKIICWKGLSWYS